MIVVWIALGVVVLCAVAVLIYARTGKPQVNGLVWRDVGDVHRTTNLKNRAKDVVSYYKHELNMYERYPEFSKKPNINGLAKRLDYYIPADMHNDYFDAIQKELDEQGIDEKITIRAYFYPNPSAGEGNFVAKAPHIHTVKLYYMIGGGYGEKEDYEESGFYCTLCDARFLYTNEEMTEEKVEEESEKNSASMRGMIDLLDWTYGEGKYADQKKEEVED